jgi:replicative DNA helicase
MNRLAILETRLSAHEFRDPRRMAEDDYRKAKRGLLALGDLPVQLCDQAGLRPVQISNLARQMHEDGAELIVVDFVQIIQEDGRDRREAINRVSAALRDGAKELGIPFVVASQLARRGNDPNTRPTMQDLRESGNLEQDAHNVLMLYRPKVADPETGAMDWSGDDKILIEKQREGVTGSVPVRYDDELLCFGARR